MDDLLQTRQTLQSIYRDICDFQLPAERYPVLDSSLDGDENQWLYHDQISGLNKLRDNIKVDIEVIEKFLSSSQSPHDQLPPLSTNAPYLIAVWNELRIAPAHVVAVFKSFPLTSENTKAHATGQAKKTDSCKQRTVKVDVVAADGQRWIRVNTIKNSRLLAELKELDSYDTESSNDESDIPPLSPIEFDNSVLRMGRQLLSAAKSNLILSNDAEGNARSIIPSVSLHLPRLKPQSNDIHDDVRITKTIEMLEDMGIDVTLGERQETKTQQGPLSLQSETPSRLTKHINLDLSVLIALVSDLTHSKLPDATEEANIRYTQVPLSSRSRKTGNIGDTGDVEDSSVDISDTLQHCNAITRLLFQEMSRSMIEEIHYQLSHHIASDLSQIQFWTTPEARDRCNIIVAKIGGPSERLRAASLFDSDGCSSYWNNSRFSTNFLPFLPVRIYSSNIPPRSELEDHVPPSFAPRSPFFKRLDDACRNLLEPQDQDVAGKALQIGVSARATPIKVNAHLTLHTVKSLLWGAKLGYTTLTANRTSVKAILKEIGHHRPGAPTKPSDVFDEDVDCKAALWLVDPRSLAESLRSFRE